MRTATTTVPQRTAQKLVAPHRGILAADESIRTMSARLDAVGVTPSAQTRAAWRELVLTTTDLAAHVSGIILNEETFGQTMTDGTPFPDAAAALGILAGIKVDKGTVALPGHPDEVVTEGLDGLAARLADFRSRGAAFAKWRAVIRIADPSTGGAEQPTVTAVAHNAHVLARYALACQEADLVPIVEPEVLMEGAHPIERTEAVTTSVLRTVVAEMVAQGVALEGIVLKPNMVVAGASCPSQPPPRAVAEATLRALRRSVPAAVPGIAFLSGGQSPEQATAHLQALNEAGPQPWALTFSFGRALLDPALATWRGEPGNVAAAQVVLGHRVRCAAAARDGRYGPALEAA